VGYSIDSRMTADLAVTSLRTAVALRAPLETTLHSDRESQYRVRKYVGSSKGSESPDRWAGSALASTTKQRSPSFYGSRRAS
jgi:hypothetical protein